MTTFSFTEENYLKTIYHLAKQDELVSTSAIANEMQTKASSVSDMLKKLAVKKVVKYYKYKGVEITEEGKKQALMIIRKHRLWEVFLVEKLNFNWDEVHEVAEQLEHIKSQNLITRLDAFLNFPKFDPHGDPIPDKDGNITQKPKILLSEAKQDIALKVVGVKDSSSEFLRYLDSTGIVIDTLLTIKEKVEYDSSLKLEMNANTLFISQKVSENIYVVEG